MSHALEAAPSPIRIAFLESAGLVRPLLASEEVRRSWDTPSALEHLSVGALTGHLMRAVTTVDSYLDRPAPTGAAILDAPAYFLSIDLGEDLSSEVNTAIRRRAVADAESGHAGVVERWTEAVDRMQDRLISEPADRLLTVLGDRVLGLDDYLVTRLVEMLVHADDLAVSVGLPRPQFGTEAEDAVVACLVEVARRRHGTPAVVTALTRRERDAVQALRVL